MAADDDRDRLIRIEEGVKQHSEQLGKLTGLLERVLVLEQARSGENRRLDELEKKLEAADKELANWRVARIVGVWLLGIPLAGATAWIISKVVP